MYYRRDGIILFVQILCHSIAGYICKCMCVYEEWISFLFTKNHHVNVTDISDCTYRYKKFSVALQRKFSLWTRWINPYSRIQALSMRCALVFMFLSSFWIQIWYHFYLQSIWLIYQHIHIPKTMSASNLTKFATELLFFIPRNICCFAISTPSDSIGSKSYHFFTTL